MFSAIGIKFPLATYREVKDSLPPATVYRTLSYQFHDGFIELYYILDTEIFSQKQKSWVGNIKTRISRKLSNVEFEFVELGPDATVRAGTADIYTLKSLSDVWRKVKVMQNKEDFCTNDKPDKKSILSKLQDSEFLDDEFIDEMIRVPQLIPLVIGGKEHENLYKTLCIYCKRLYYEKLFIYEYLEIASSIYSSEMKLLPKEKNKITLKAWTFMSEQIELNPDDFKKKLEPEELKAVKSAHGKRLQKYNQMIRADNIELVKEAISSGKCLKANGSINVGKVAAATALNRKTVEKILLNNSILP